MNKSVFPRIVTVNGEVFKDKSGQDTEFQAFKRHFPVECVFSRLDDHAFDLYRQQYFINVDDRPGDHDDQDGEDNEKFFKHGALSLVEWSCGPAAQ